MSELSDPGVKSRLPARASSETVPSIDGLDSVVDSLFEPGAVSFTAIGEALAGVPDLTPPVLAHLQEGVMEKVRDTLMMGNFRDLRGIETVLPKLQMSGLGLSDEIREELNALLPRISERALTQLGLSQPAAVGEYNHEKAREILGRVGFQSDELDDSAVEKILDYRHILMALHQASVQHLDGGRGEIQAARLLITE